jgi:hypothetical protein
MGHRCWNFVSEHKHRNAGFMKMTNSGFLGGISAILLQSIATSQALPTLQGPTNQTVAYGAAATLTVSASTTGPTTYQWRQNGVDLTRAVLLPCAGGNSAGFGGDGGPAANAQLASVQGFALTASGELYFSDSGNHRIRKISTNGIISTIAGTRSTGYNGDNLPATNATLYYPYGLALDKAGNLLVADCYNNRIRKIDTNGIISTVAGNGYEYFPPGGGSATSVGFNSPRGLAISDDGVIFVTCGDYHRVYRVDTNGMASVAAGTGTAGEVGDGGFATNATLGEPYGLALDTLGNLYIADHSSNCVRKVSTNGIISTVVGLNHPGGFGDGGYATNASLSEPYSVAVDTQGNLFIADYGNRCVRQIATNGIISTVAGSGVQPVSVSGLAALSLALAPSAVACDALGNLVLGSGAQVHEIPLASGSPVLSTACATTNFAGSYEVVVTDATGSNTSSAATVTLTLPSTTDGWLQAGTTALAARDLAAASFAFEQAVSLTPSNPEANAKACISRFFLIPQQPAVSNYLTTRFELAPTKLHAFNWSPKAEFETNGMVEFFNSVLGVVKYLIKDACFHPGASLNSADAIALFNTNIMPVILACDTNMSRITDPAYTCPLTTNDTHMAQPITFDRGDFLVLRSLVHALSFAEHTSKAHNFEFDLRRLLDLYDTNSLTIERFLSDYPGFLAKTAVKQAELQLSKRAFTNGASFYFAGSGFIRTNRATNVNRLFNFDSSLTNYEATIRDFLAKAVESVDQPVVFDTTNNYAIYLGGYFDCTNAVRDYLPSFNGNIYAANSLPDYTVHEIIQGMPAWKVESICRDVLGSTPAGIYCTNLLYSSKVNGRIAAYVETNGDTVIIGTATNKSKAIYARFHNPDLMTQFTDLEWEDSTNGVDFDLSFEKGFQASAPYITSTCSGSLEDSASSWNATVPDCRPLSGSFDSVAGVYSGAWTSTNLSPNVSGRIEAILAPNGNFCFVEFDSDGSLADSGFCQVTTNGICISTSVSGVRSSNAMDLATGIISGVFSSSTACGTISMQRSAWRSVDAQPSLASGLASQTGKVGGKVTFSVAAQGSAPLCYQWYSNNVAIKGATASSLTLSNLSAKANGAAISVAVHNVVGESRASATLKIDSAATDTTLPVITVKYPLAGKAVSNAVIAVQGTASDKAGLAGVWLQLNDQADWTAATGTTNWSGQLSLTQRTNRLRCYAQDLAGNLSKTNTLLFYYVPSVGLHLTVRGNGTLTPSATNLLVESNKLISLIAKAKTGSIFSNWTDQAGVELGASTTLSLRPVSDTNITVNFVPNPFTALKGSFAGLYLSTNVETTNSGFFTAAVTQTGSFSAKFQGAKASVSWSGQLSTKGGAATSLPATKSSEALSLELWLDMTRGTNLTGRISGSGWSAAIQAYPVFYAKTNLPAQAGKLFTMAIPGAEASSTLPGGFGGASVSVDAAGNVTLQGNLSDGAAMAQKTFVNRAAQWPLFASLYSGKGAIIGWMTFTNNSPTNLGGLLYWTKQPVAGAALYPAGFRFSNGIPPEVSVYSASTKPLLSWTNGSLTLSEGALATPLANHLVLNNAKATGSNGLSLNITAATGLFKGSIKPPGGKSLSFNGVLLQSQQLGCGWFLGTTNTGTLLLESNQSD